MWVEHRFLANQWSRVWGFDFNWITVWDEVMNVLHHVVPASADLWTAANNERIVHADWLWQDLQERGNLLHNWKYWYVNTTIWPYWDKHIMLIYKWASTEITNLWHLKEDEKRELFSLLGYIAPSLYDEFRREIESWDLEFYLWINQSLIPWPLRSQTLHRPHFHIILISWIEKEHNNIVSKTETILDERNPDKNNRHMLALNKQNLFMMRDFERFLPPELRKIMDNSVITPDMPYSWSESYWLDFELPEWKMFCKEWVELVESLRMQGDLFLQMVKKRTSWIVSEDTLKAIDRAYINQKEVPNKIDWIGFTISFWQKNGKWYLRFRFAYKNMFEDSWVLESWSHAIFKDRFTDNKVNQDWMKEIVRSMFS